MTTRRIRYGTPCQFRFVTHAQLEHFDNKPPPQPLEEPEQTARTAKATIGTQSEATTSESKKAKTKSAADKMLQSEGNSSISTTETTATYTDDKGEVWIPDRGGGWDGKVTKYDASTMYLG